MLSFRYSNNTSALARYSTAPSRSGVERIFDLGIFTLKNLFSADFSIVLSNSCRFFLFDLQEQEKPKMDIKSINMSLLNMLYRIFYFKKLIA